MNAILKKKFKQIGFDYFASNVKQGLKSESYIMKKLTKKLALVTQETDSQELALSITKGRQEIESGIFRIQFRNSTMHLVEKDWYTTWLAFISGKICRFFRFVLFYYHPNKIHQVSRRKFQGISTMNLFFYLMDRLIRLYLWESILN